MPKNKATPMTPEIKAQVEKWINWLKDIRGARFNPSTDTIYKAKVVVDTGHCPCKPDRKCPCPQCMAELTKYGTCFCRVFCTKDYLANPEKYPHETFAESEAIK